MTERAIDTKARDALLKAAEDKIQRILLDLDEELTSTFRQQIDEVRADTRRFANLKVEIFAEPYRP